MAVLLAELLMIFLGGYAAGCVLGSGAAALVYGKAGRIFITRNVTVHSRRQHGRDGGRAVGIGSAGCRSVSD